MRKPIIVGNWKMNKTMKETKEFMEAEMCIRDRHKLMLRSQLVKLVHPYVFFSSPKTKIYFPFGIYLLLIHIRNLGVKILNYFIICKINLYVVIMMAS